MTEPFREKESARFIGIDAGAETLKLVELVREESGLRVRRREFIEHGKQPGPALLTALECWDWPAANGAAASGFFSSQLRLLRVPAKQAQLRAYAFLFGPAPVTIVNIGCRGFSVLELASSGQAVFRENSRCSQGTGNFLRQLVERFSLTVEQASALCADVPNPAPLSGRCPVILKTDMTHLANKGEDRARVLAGLFDAVCENVMALIKPGISPGRILLTGGVSRSARVRRVFAERLEKQGLELLPADPEAVLYLDAIGSALLAAEAPAVLPRLEELLLPPQPLKLERLPSLCHALDKVRRMPAHPPVEVNGESRRLIMGFDVGSTGSKAVALDALTRETVWEGYRQTLGDPVGAAQDLLRRFTVSSAAKCPVIAFGATGSGREIAGSLLASCFGREAVFIVNEIVAHATGALHYDPRVDTIFEIGGQDAKYIRLADGRIVDCAMNEACSAGTGSFIEEQGRKFSGIHDVRELGRAAITAPEGVSLGQHCSVFMAEVIDDAVAAGIDQPSIISGLYDSIIKNYLNRVKGNRSVGKVIFCQGMPFSANALAAAVARQTGSDVIIPPNPGTVGALGIALLTARELNLAQLPPLDPTRFLEARVESRDTFICRSNCGCGGQGNRCRIERLRTRFDDARAAFTWGGNCSLHDKGTRRRKLPDLAPDPFRERDDLVRQLVEVPTVSPGKPRIAISDEFMLKGLLPFFATFFHQAGLELEIVTGAGVTTLKRGIQAANVPFCAPMQFFHGVAERMAESPADWLFVPRLRSLPRVPGQQCSVVCPIVQASPDILRWMLESRRPGTASEAEPGAAVGRTTTPRLLSAQIDFADGSLDSKSFRESCRQMAVQLGVPDPTWRRAWDAAIAAQRRFNRDCLEIGRRTLEYCSRHGVVPVVVLGRAYTIYNQVLNSNVPAILREQGAIGIPVDCYPVDAQVPMFPDMYWGYGHEILRAAHQVRRHHGVYALYCSNYSCGPDSFTLHFAAYVMEGKPFAIIETDGHSGDAGTKTRVEAFLHCVEEDRRPGCPAAVANDFAGVQSGGRNLAELRRQCGRKARLLVPWIGPASEVVAAVFRGLRVPTEALPAPDAESLRRGRRFTSGKECLPMPLTLGSLLQRLEQATPEESFIYLMPGTDGPCRFGAYNLLNQIVLDRLGWRQRVHIWSPKDRGYFDNLPAGAEMLLFAGFVASDLLLQAQLDVRPAERERGSTEAQYRRHQARLLGQLESAASKRLSLPAALCEVLSGRLFGIPEVLRRAGADISALRGPADLPVVELTGEIYVRSVDFCNDFIIDKLEARGLRVHLSPKTEWLNYCAYLGHCRPGRSRFLDGFSERVQRRIEITTRAAIAPFLGWPAPPTIAETLSTARPYLSESLEGEAVLTVGAPLHEWRQRQIEAVVSVGPLECMPTKIAEAQFHHVAEREDLLSLTLSFNGDPVNTAVLDNFAFEVKARRQVLGSPATTPCLPVADH